LALEAHIAKGPGVEVLCEHAARLSAALEDAVARGAAGIISFGIAGGLASELRAGDWVVASGIRDGGRIIPTDAAWARNLLAALPHSVHAQIIGSDVLLPESADKQRLHAQTGAAAVDMESHIAARVAAAHRIPLVACRTIIDAAHRELPPAASVGLREDGTADVLAVCRSLMDHPGQLPDLMRTAYDAFIARRALRHGRQRMGVGLGYPQLSVERRGFAFGQAAALAARVTARYR
jgi:hopanoid-associated phosphorylase